MKNFRFFLIFCLISVGYLVISQNHILPAVDIFSLDGLRVSAKDIVNIDQPFIIVFWKRYDKISLEQISMINEEYDNSLKDKNVKVIGICMDASGNMASIKPFVFGNNIGFEMYIDKNGDLKRAMNVPDFPYTIIFDRTNNICYKQIGYFDPVVELLENSIVNSLATIKDK
jgi:hypothetical protein